MKRLLKPFVKRHPMLYTLAGWLLSGVGPPKERYTAGGGFFDQTPEETLAYARRIYRFYLEYAGEAVLGGEIAEVGPGSNVGTAWLMLAGGARRVDLIERWPVPDCGEYWAATGRRLGLEESAGRSMRWLTGVDGDAARHFATTRAGYDGILSNVALEYVPEALPGMARALKPGGCMVHGLDLSDHGLFGPHVHPWKFLEIPEWWYRHGRGSFGWPSQYRAGDYRESLAGSGLAVTVLVTSLFGVGSVGVPRPWEELPEGIREAGRAWVRTYRSRLAAPFRERDEADLAPNGAVLVAKRER